MILTVFGQTMLWSKTNELVHKYTAKDEDKKDCFTLEDTLLGYILNDERWCGKKGSNGKILGL